MVLIDAEDNLVACAQHLVVVGTEELPVVFSRLQLIAQVDYLLAVLGTLLIVGCASIDSCIQIELGQNHIAQTLAGAIFLRICRQQISCLLHILREPVEELGTAHLLRCTTTHSRGLIGERYIAEQINGVEIAQTTDGTSLCTILLHEGIVTASGINLTNHLITERNLIEYTAVASADENVTGCPLQSVKVSQCLVVPADDCFVGRQLLQVEQGAQILTETTVDTFNIGIAAITVG